MSIIIRVNGVEKILIEKTSEQDILVTLICFNSECSEITIPITPNKENIEALKALVEILEKITK